MVAHLPLILFRILPDTGPEMGAGVVVRNRLLRCFRDRIYRYERTTIGFFAERDGAGFERE